MATKSQALVKLYEVLNHPVKAGPKLATYRRETIDACLEVVKQLAIAEGAEFVPINEGSNKVYPSNRTDNLG